MPFSVQDLTQDNPPLDVATPKQTVVEVMERMGDNDFSQLPVVDEDKRPLGMVTHQSILHAVRNLQVPLAQLRVVDAMQERAAEFREDSDLFDLLDTLRDKYAALVVDGEGRLTGIVTNYDTAEYFRRRAEDMMHVEDVETTLKDYINLAFLDSNGEVDEEERRVEVERITDRSRELRDGFEAALKQYLGTSNRNGRPVNIDESIADSAFQRHLYRDDSKSDFEDLTLNDYIHLFLAKDRWPRYKAAFSMGRKDLIKLLEDVRDTRNALAHFRDDLTDEQRHQLRFCADWLARHQPMLATLFPTTGEPGTAESIEDETGTEDESLTINEEIGPHESRYAPLAAWLQNRPPDKDVIYVTFKQIEDLIDGDLPASAYKHRAWWANDSTGHVQAQQWLDVGWRVGEVAMSARRVRFVRVKGLEGQYIDFFGKLVNDLREQTDMPLKDASPHGSSYHHLNWLRYKDGPRALIFAFAFARGKRCRIELYIDTGDKARNKRIYDRLHADKEEFESALGVSLTWERLNENRASRIAWYHPGSIQNSEEDLEALRTWAVEAVPAFYDAFIEPTKSALAAVTPEE